MEKTEKQLMELDLSKFSLIYPDEETQNRHYRGEDFRIQRKPLQTNSLHVEYDFPHIKPFDCLDISTEDDSFYCFPTKQNVVTKLAFATEIIYQRKEEEARQKRAARV